MFSLNKYLIDREALIYNPSADVWYREYELIFDELSETARMARNLQKTISEAKFNMRLHKKIYELSSSSAMCEECKTLICNSFGISDSIFNNGMREEYKCLISNSSDELIRTMHIVTKCYFALKYLEGKLQEHVGFSYTSRASEYEEIFRNLGYWSEDDDE